ncbi:helix-turn-helix domain-containing protein [Streptomyces peucetius]|uniref:Helix-turn-helix domain-containing protein n=1 Tax=Streptomyces peucetius TaxID=1950 RepID=A0ABY6IDY6_STRPE|nr:helix-turn-helix domain-containing protein [Streptomyces peucetius]UYQ65221.1 helix-turn-helix domain-containing protein [Streptomyces peucetius]
MYEERASRIPGAVVWTRTAGPGAAYPVLPDGCMDLLWSEGRLFVAGPDTHAHAPGGTAAWAGVRFAPGAAPAVLGVPAHELRDRRVELADLWGAAPARRLAELIGTAADEAAALETVALERAVPPDPLTTAVVRHLDAGGTVAAAADAAGLSARQLHRRSLDAFGYGPKTLARVLRLQRALTLVRRGVPYGAAALAAGCADQAHLAREMRALAGITLGAYDALAKSETPSPSGSSTTA